MTASRLMSGAVFLSYASQDAEAARRISDALAAAGAEVWFDQSELRGGDSWDQKIRRQIRECAIFIPVISASTQSRSEGYFRREWKLAVDRTHDMADHVAFLVPVVLDGTSDRDAHVPDKFRDVQWTRLPGGETPASFAERVRALASGGVPASATERAAAPKTQGQRRSGGRGRWIGGAAACALVAIAVAVWAPWKKASSPSSAPALPAQAVPGPQNPTAPATDASPDPRSVAVLPFENLSDDKQNEYFSDGISEELLTVLQKIPGLHVAAQTSAFFYKGKNILAQEIGRQLRVANLVEGSVQKIGNRVRITARLSRAATGEEIWAVSFPPREVTDVFALQDEIAQAIVAQLRGRLGGDVQDPSSKAEIETQVQAAEKGGTRNADAHQLYLEGLFFLRQFSRESFISAEERFRHAVQLDPSYALAWAGLSSALAHEWAWTSVASPAAIDECHAAARRALELEPNLSEGYDALFYIQTSYDFDLAGAAASSRKALELAPNAGDSLEDAGLMALVYGDLDRAIVFCRQADAVDPLNTEYHLFLANILSEDDRVDEAVAEMDQILAFNPETSHIKGLKALVYASHRTRLPEALALAGEEKEQWVRLTAQAATLWEMKRFPESDASLKELIDTNANIAAYQIAEIHASRNEPDAAFQWLERAFRQHDGGLPWILRDPCFIPLHQDPRWAPFLQKLHLQPL